MGQVVKSRPQRISRSCALMLIESQSTHKLSRWSCWRSKVFAGCHRKIERARWWYNSIFIICFLNLRRESREAIGRWGGKCKYENKVCFSYRDWIFNYSVMQFMDVCFPSVIDFLIFRFEEERDTRCHFHFRRSPHLIVIDAFPMNHYFVRRIFNNPHVAPLTTRKSWLWPNESVIISSKFSYTSIPLSIPQPSPDIA